LIILSYINEKVKFWDYSYRVHLHEYDTKGLLVNANNESDALDYAIDYAEKHGWEGLFAEPAECTQEELDHMICGGNSSRYLSSSDYVRIIKLD